MSIKVIVEKKQYKKKFYDKKEEIAKALEKEGYDDDAAFAIADSAAEDAGYKELKEEEEELDQLDERSRKKRKKARKRRKKKKKIVDFWNKLVHVPSERNLKRLFSECFEN